MACLTAVLLLSALTSLLALPTKADDSQVAQSPLIGGDPEDQIGGGWEPATLLGSDESQGIRFHDVAVSSNGTAIVVWATTVSFDRYPWRYHTTVWSNRYDPAHGWGSAVRVGSALCRVESLKVAMAPLGDAVVAWQCPKPESRTGIWASHYLPGLGWGTPEVMPRPVPDIIERAGLDVAIDSYGRALVVSGQRSSDQFQVNYTWAYDDVSNAWTNLEARWDLRWGQPPGPLVYDEASQRLIQHGARLTLAYDPERNAWVTVAADLSINPGYNHPLCGGFYPGPCHPVYGHAMAYDAESKRIILFGGSNSHGGLLNLTWTFDSNTSTWTRMNPPNAPSARSRHAMVYDAASDRVILFGGVNYSDSSSLFGDTWAYNYNDNTWTALNPTKPPSARRSAAMAYDTESDRVILFGGFARTESGGSQYVRETWVYDYDSNSWTDMDPQTDPPTESIRDMAYHPRLDLTVTPSSRAYDYNRNEWIDLDPISQLPGGRLSNGQLEYDPSTERIILWGGTEKKTVVLSQGLEAAAFNLGVGWDTAFLGPSRALRSGGPLSVGMTEAGNAVVVWSTSAVHASTFAPGIGWGPPIFLERPANVRPLPAAFSPSGKATVVWNEGSSVWGSQFTPATGWSTPVSLPGVGSALDAEASSESGVIAVGAERWTATPSGWVAKFHPDFGWAMVDSIPLPLESYGSSRAFGTPRIAADQNNSGLLVWTDRFGDGPLVVASRFDAVGGLSAPEPVGKGEDPRIAMDESGNAIVVWIEAGEDGSSVWARRFAVESVAPDLTPPSLTLATPLDRSIVVVPAVTVSGATEPGSRLSVNGIEVSVDDDGSFSFLLALEEGVNTITAVAMDGAGNSATVSVTVEFVNPVPGLRETLRETEETLQETENSVANALRDRLLLFALQAVFAGAIILLSLLYWQKGRGGSGTGWNPFSRVNPLAGREIRRPRKQVARREDTHRTQAEMVDRPWPQTELGNPLHLPIKDRVALHLLECTRFADAAEVPPLLTQEGIAMAAGFSRRHFAQNLRPLVREGLVQERLGHVTGALQRQKVYALTHNGWRRALGVRERIESAVTSVTDDSGVREATIGDVRAEARGSKSLLDIVREAIEGEAQASAPKE